MDNPLLNQIDAWAPGCWCAAVLNLCEDHRVEDGTDTLFYPAQWVYFLWRPREEALPFAWPDSWCFTRSPFDEIRKDVGDGRVYFLRDEETDWPILLDILLTCDAAPPWLRKLIEDHHRTKQQELRRRFIGLYGDTPANEFMARVKRIIELEALRQTGDFGKPL
jgi:hypothetical protein